MRQVEGSVMLVTGSTDGIGKETVRRLAEMGAAVLVHSRGHERGEEALEEIREGPAASVSASWSATSPP